MKTLNIHITAFLLVLTMAGCVKKEGTLPPGEEPENVYGDHTLPQGDHAYDADIVAFYKKYNTLILYKYKSRDIYWNVNRSIEPYYDEPTNYTSSGYLYTPPDENYIQPLLELMNTQFFNYFPDELLKKNLPRKIYLMDKYMYVSFGTGRPEQQAKTYYKGALGFDYLAVTGASPDIINITPAQKRAFRGDLTYLFLQQLVNNGTIPRLAAFSNLTNYALAMPTWDLRYGNGIIIWEQRTPNLDWDAYLKVLLTMTDSQLKATGGFWNPAIDNKGTIRKKSDVMINYFKTNYNIDLRAIANDL